MLRKINFSLISLTFLMAFGCKRVADSINVESNIVPKSVSSRLEPKEVNIDSRMRAMTLLSYPISSDVTGWNFEIGEETKASWELFLNSLKFGSKIKSSFDASANPKNNIVEIVNVVQSAGESRDQSFKKIVPLRKELVAFDLQMEKIKLEKTPSDLDTFVCFYAKRPTGSKPFECKAIKDETYSKEKTANNCRDFLKFKFIDIESTSIIAERGAVCESVQKELDVIKEKSLAIDQKIADEMLIRSAGESVVLDLLQSIEKYQTNLVLIATGATLEKNKDVSDPVSSIVIDKDNSISTFKLIIDFGPNLSSGGGKVEYSRERENVKNLTFKKESDGVWTLRFDLITSDFTVKATLSHSIHDILGRRFVGDAHFYYPNGIVRKGVMKLEFDQINN